MGGEWPDLHALELLVAVVDAGSVGAGARSLGMAQSNASRLVSRLETTAGAPLLQRGPRGSVPTDKGVELAAAARTLLEQSRQFLAMLGEGRASGPVEVRVGASQTVAEVLMPAWLAELRRRLPEVRVQLQVLNSSQVITKVHQGELQLGFVETPQLQVGISAAVVQEDELAVAVGPGHPWANLRGRLSLRELAATPLVVRERGSGTREALEQLLAGREAAEPALVLQGNAAVRIAVASGAGPAVLSELALREQLAAGSLLRVPLEVEVPKRPLTAVWLGPQRLAGAMAELVAIAAS
ncbi:LysR family transcriptional regulator [Arthrobacter rhombi]|uniref:LysR family transcriptional regulator n=1 Tax=Arthrobacter rhombi TaxID=71253 RepID=UPI0031E037C4